MSLSSEGQRLVWRGLEVDPIRHRVTINGTVRDLRRLEYKLLLTLIEQPGRVFSRIDLLANVWRAGPDKGTRTVDTHVRRLRARLDEYGDAIETVHGFGYRFRDQPSTPPEVGCSRACALFAEHECPYR